MLNKALRHSKYIMYLTDGWFLAFNINLFYTSSHRLLEMLVDKKPAKILDDLMYNLKRCHKNLVQPCSICSRKEFDWLTFQNTRNDKQAE